MHDVVGEIRSERADDEDRVSTGAVLCRRAEEALLEGIRQCDRARQLMIDAAMLREQIRELIRQPRLVWVPHKEGTVIRTNLTSQASQAHVRDLSLQPEPNYFRPAPRSGDGPDGSTAIGFNIKYPL